MRWWCSPGRKYVFKTLWKCRDGIKEWTSLPSKVEKAQPSRWPARDLSTCRVFIVAGEASGDAIGSRLMASLCKLSPYQLEFAGVGGPLMEREGLKSQFPMEDISIMGLLELIPHTLRLWMRLRETIAAAVKFQPNVVITIDSKGFSFRLLHGITDAYAGMSQCRPLAVHYVAPSFWAWKGGEETLRHLSKIIDHMLCILPFEEASCQANGIGATFVGHPVLEDAFHVTASAKNDDGPEAITGDAANFREQHGLHKGSTLLSVLPGSRLQEVQRMLPIFESAMTRLQNSDPDLTVVIPTAQPGSVTRAVEALVAKWRVPVVLLPGASCAEKYNALTASNAALCTSGTAVLQTHLASVPCVAAYRAHPITEYFIRRRTKLQFISLPNILLNSAIIPEALFGACTAGQIVSYLRPLIDDEIVRKKQLLRAEELRDLLSPVTHEMSISSTMGSSSLENRIMPRKPSFVAASCILKLLEDRAHRIKVGSSL